MTVDMENSTKKQHLKKDMPKNPEEWKKWKKERKALKRERREEMLIKVQEKYLEKKKKEAVMIKEPETTDVNSNDATGRPYTVSIAVPGSILDNAQSPELRTYLAGQIARAAVVFKVDEIIVFDETGSTEKTTEGEFTGIGKHGRGNVQLARILQYLECPQYLRKSFFPQHKDLQYAGVLNPLDSPHHMKVDDIVPYREGVVLDKPVKEGQGSFVNCGLLKEVQVDKHIQVGVRVTVKMDYTQTGKKKFRGTIVSPNEPRTKAGLYWGYSVRLATSLSSIFTQCPYDKVYDLTIGTSERGENVNQFTSRSFKHALIVFGGVKGLEASLEADESLEVDDPKYLFQHYLNTCPDQGSGTIRTEEAILITLSALRPVLTSQGTQSTLENQTATQTASQDYDS